MSTTSLLIALLGILSVGLFYFFASRVKARRQKDAADLMKSPVFLKVSDELGAKPNLKSLLSTVEGKALLDKMTFCEDCKAAEECHLFFSESSLESKKPSSFCPNEGIFSDLATKLRTKADRPHS